MLFLYYTTKLTLLVLNAIIFTLTSFILNSIKKIYIVKKYLKLIANII